MTVQAIRLQNFMGFQDTGWVELRTINLLFGRNSTGKSAILRALLLLRQSLDSRPEDGPLTFVAEDGQDFGGYRQMVYGQRIDRNMSFWFQCDFSTFTPVRDRLKAYLLALARQDVQSESMALDTYRFRLIFSWDKRQKRARLIGADLYDQQGNLILGATTLLKEEGQVWQFRSDFFDPNQNDSNIVQDNLQTTLTSETSLWPYSRLVIDQGFLPRLDYPASTLPEPPDNVPYEDNESIPTTTSTCVRFLREMRHSISTFLRAIHYLGPLRAEPLRYYYVPEAPGNRLDAQGRRVVQSYLAGQRNRANEDRIAHINQWLADAGVGNHLNFKPVNQQKTLYEIELVESAATTSLHPNLREVGFGVSQVLPILIQAMLAPAGSTVLIEQPELHLHPGAQAELGDLFIAATKLGIRFLIETHSEHLLLRLRSRITRSRLQQIEQETGVSDASDKRTDSPHELRGENLALYFVDRNAQKSHIHTIEMDEQGQYQSVPEGFRRFFSNDYDEVMQMNLDLAKIFSLGAEHEDRD